MLQSPLSAEIEDFIVLPAYPNPFNPTTTINFGVNREIEISIEVYDIIGNLITNLYKGRKSEGWYSVIWNGTNSLGKKVPAGQYLVNIASNESKIIKKITYLK